MIYDIRSNITVFIPKLLNENAKRIYQLSFISPLKTIEIVIAFINYICSQTSC